MNRQNSEWILNPIVEREFAEERRAQIAKTRAAWIASACWVGLCPFSCLSLGGFIMSGLAQDSDPPIPTAFLVLLLILGGTAASLIHRSLRRNRIRERRIQKLAEEYQSLPQNWLVDLNIIQGATVTGQDQGAIWFEGDRLYFSGYRTSFSLTSGDVQGSLRQRFGIQGVRSNLAFELAKSTPAGTVSLGIDFLPLPNQSVEKATREFFSSFRGWRASRTPGIGKWPPLAIGPEIPPARNILLAALPLPIYLVVVSLLLVLCPAEPVFLIFAAFVAVICAFLSPEIWLPHSRWRAFCDRRRLDRNLP